MNLSPKKIIISHSSIYLLGSIFQRCASFIMLPIYTRYLSPSDYGIIELITMALDLVTIVFGFRISQSIFRYYNKYQNKEKNEVVSTSLYVVIFLNLVGFVLIYFFSDFLSKIIFGDFSQSTRISIFALTIVGQGATEIPLIVMRANQKPGLYIISGTLKLIFQLIFNIYFVVYRGLGVDGVIYSALIVTALSGTSLTTYTFVKNGIIFSLTKAKELVNFSIPLVVSDIIGFYITFADKYFIRIILGVDDVGVYSLGYKFGFLLVFIVTGPFSNIWDTEKYKISKKDNCKVIYQDVFIYYSMVLLLIGFFILLFVKDIIFLMTDISFHDSYKPVFFILAAYIVNSWSGYVNFGLYYKNKTSEILYGTILSVVVMSAIFYPLIYNFGLIGASLAVFIGFLTRMLWIYFRSKKYFDMCIKWNEIYGIILIFLSAYLISMFIPDNLIVSIFYRLIILLIVLTIFIITPIIPMRIKCEVKYIILNQYYRISNYFYKDGS